MFKVFTANFKLNSCIITTYIPNKLHTIIKHNYGGLCRLDKCTYLSDKDILNCSSKTWGRIISRQCNLYVI